MRPDDRMRGYAIEPLLCDFRVDLNFVAHAFGFNQCEFDEAIVRLRRMICVSNFRFGLCAASQ